VGSLIFDITYSIYFGDGDFFFLSVGCEDYSVVMNLISSADIS